MVEKQEDAVKKEGEAAGAGAKGKEGKEGAAKKEGGKAAKEGGAKGAEEEFVPPELLAPPPSADGAK